MTSPDFSAFTKSLASLVLTLSILAHASAIAAAETLRLGFSGGSATQLAGYLAVDQKLFDLYGVNVELTQSAGTTMIRALDSGGLHAAHPLSFYVGRYIQSDAGKVRIVARSISQRVFARDQACLDQSGYGKKDIEPKHADHRPRSA